MTSPRPHWRSCASRAPGAADRGLRGNTGRFRFCCADVAGVEAAPPFVSMRRKHFSLGKGLQENLDCAFERFQNHCASLGQRPSRRIFSWILFVVRGRLRAGHVSAPNANKPPPRPKNLHVRVHKANVGLEDQRALPLPALQGLGRPTSASFFGGGTWERFSLIESTMKFLGPGRVGNNVTI